MKDSRNSLDAGDWPDSPYDDPKAIQREITGAHNWKTQRGLSSRNVQFLALVGCIGTGLFVGSGQALSTVGPGEKQLQKHKLDMGLICDSSFDHGLYCHVKYRILCHENARWNDHLSPPVQGVSVPYFITRFTEPSLGLLLVCQTRLWRFSNTDADWNTARIQLLVTSTYVNVRVVQTNKSHYLGIHFQSCWQQKSLYYTYYVIYRSREL